MYIINITQKRKKFVAGDFSPACMALPLAEVSDDTEENDCGKDDEHDDQETV